MTNKKGDSNTVGIGTGILAGAAAIAAGYYFYASPEAKKHRKIVVEWATDLKEDVMKEAKKLTKIDQDSIMKIVDQVAEVYHTTRNIDKEDVGQAVKELKGNWQELLKEMKASGKKVASKAKVKAKAKK